MAIKTALKTIYRRKSRHEAILDGIRKNESQISEAIIERLRSSGVLRDAIVGNWDVVCVLPRKVKTSAGAELLLDNGKGGHITEYYGDGMYSTAYKSNSPIPYWVVGDINSGDVLEIIQEAQKSGYTREIRALESELQNHYPFLF